VTPPPANPSTLLARGVVDSLVAHGVEELVLAPGSRNAPLAFAAYDAAAAGRLRLHTRLDERTAGFLALGMTRVGRRAAVVCTSGTAVANLHPAVLEAAHAGLPLVVVTADRPASVRGTGASQTTDQVRIFGDATGFLDVALDAGERLRHRLDEARAQVDAFLAPGADAVRPGPFGGSGGDDGRPVHLNVQLSPPLVPDVPAPAGAPAPERRAATPVRPRGSWRRPPGGRCSPSPPAVRARGPAWCAATGCCSTATRAATSSGWWSGGTRRSPAR
jgi:2-succinyl-5-enolpyruvyl-6-hydroxy-3-cyclohexene-1-carboxylate synthase